MAESSPEPGRLLSARFHRYNQTVICLSAPLIAAECIALLCCECVIRRISIIQLTFTLVYIIMRLSCWCFSAVFYVERTRQHCWRCSNVTFQCSEHSLCLLWIQTIKDQLALLSASLQFKHKSLLL